MQQLKDRYTRACHKVQTAIAFMVGRPEYRAAEPKHLRVGVDCSKADHSALAGLLIAKGIFTEEEYIAALADGMEREAERQEEQLQAMVSPNVRVGG